MRDSPQTILYTTTTAIASLAFFSEQFGHLRRQGWDVHFVTPAQPAEQVQRTVAASGATHHAVAFARAISPRRDLLALLALLRTAAQVRPDVINFSTPKAGLLGGLVGVVLGVPLRVYFIHGLRSETAATGRLALLRPVLLLMERLTVACAHEVLCVSPSNRDEAVVLGLVPASKIRVLGAGSPAGIPVERYAHPDPAAVAAARQELGLPVGTPVVGFVARMAPQKGTEELLLAWPQVHARVPEARLLLVGVPDPANPLSEEALRAFQEAPGLIQVEFEADMSRLYPLMTVHTLPSRHEGLGMVVLEAGAYGVPSVISDASGVRDAGVPGVTCLQVPAGDVPALADALVQLLTDQPLRDRLGQHSQAWVTENFAQEKLWSLWDDFYAEAWEKRRAVRQARAPWVRAALGLAGVALALDSVRRLRQ
ncbi:glycosyltransferase [Deinococcus sp. Marseille-Q6407]|uniref:glycosyltransferase n=1 Tax=Deinococcus sp. Marseille-Q6407 TaxID=2969223 RepID=UPI0021BE57B6|nr:glycosyltransferase [Deinococcus sp. Marseille-Q6407]